MKRRSDPSISIDVITEADIDAADEIMKLAFQSKDSRRANIRRNMFMQPGCWLMARYKGEPVGTVGATDYGPFAYIGLMAVNPRLQGRGIGFALLDELLRWLDEHGSPMSLLDATEMGRPLYWQMGFVEQGFARQFRLTQPAEVRFPEGQVEPMQASDIPGMAAFDLPIFGASREKVFAAFLADFQGRAFVTRDASGQINGYTFAQARSIGPWAAGGPDEAEALLQAALSLPFESAPGVIIPAANITGVRLLLRSGFIFHHANTHMRRGGQRHPSQRSRIYAQAGFAIG
ncbi:MAG: GNAT family N-acetyltransferase [Chloroflexota bacterium]|nr:MAG: GNAT family N-acetyltransferase [Chloroflexota bacterium]